MSATPLSFVARLVDLETDTEVIRTTEILDLAIGRVLDGPGTLRLAVRWGAFAGALIAAWAGPGYDGPVLAYLLEVSLDGGAIWDSAMWCETGKIVIGGADEGVTVDGKDIYSGFERTYRDRVTFINTRLSDILSAAPGAIRFDGDALLGLLNTLPHQRGFYDQIPVRDSMAGRARLAFTALAEGPLGDRRLNMDADGDAISRCTTTAVRAAAARYDPTDPAPYGSRAHFTVDIAGRRVLCGHVGTAPQVQLAPVDSLAALDETAHAGLLNSTLTLDMHLETMAAQAALTGGQDNHGIPDGAQITDILMIRRPADVDGLSIVWDGNLLLVALSTGDDGGGVYYLHDKTLYPCSQQMDVFKLAYDEPADTVYVATGHGVRYAGFSPRVRPWRTLGKLIAPVSDLWVAAPGQVFAVVSAGGSAQAGDVGVYGYPQLMGEESTAYEGYEGWSRLVASGGVLYAAGDAAALYFVDQAAPSTLLAHLDGRTDPVPVDVPDDAAIVGLDFDLDSGRIWVRTTAGAWGFYSLAPGETRLLDADPVRKLADTAGALTVAKVRGYPEGRHINGVAVRLLVATDRGLWWSANPLGGEWRPAAGVNGMAGVTATCLTAGFTSWRLDRQGEPVAMATPRNLYYSHTGGLFFTDLLASPLDLGPWFDAEARSLGLGDFPDDQLGALGTPAPPGDSGGAGTSVPIPDGDPFALPDGDVFGRRSTERDDWTYRYNITGSNAPYSALRPGELSEMTADDSRDAATAAAQLAIEHQRLMASARRPKFTTDLESAFTTQEAALRFSLPGDMIRVDYQYVAPLPDGSSLTVLDWSDRRFYLLGWDAAMAGNTMAVTLHVGNEVAIIDTDDTAQLAGIVAGAAEGLSQDRRYRKWRVR